MYIHTVGLQGRYRGLDYAMHLVAFSRMSKHVDSYLTLRILHSIVPITSMCNAGSTETHLSSLSLACGVLAMAMANVV